ncbi:unnamed protein product [Auanema sp. JU1783]|nr:unnamed protein product [Auanema sp. JU1783]
MDFALHLDSNSEDKALCDRLVKSAGITYSQFGNIAKLVNKRELGLIGTNDFSENTQRQVLSIDAGSLKRLRFEPTSKRIFMNDPPERPFGTFPCVAFSQLNESVEAAQEVAFPNITRRPENIMKVLRCDDAIRVQIIDGEPFYNLVTLEKNGNLICYDTKSDLRVSHTVAVGRFKGDLEWNIYGEDFYIFVETTEDNAHSLLIYSFYPLKCKYRMKVPIMQNVRHISLNKDILKCSLCNRTEFYYLKDLLDHPIKQYSKSNPHSESPVEFTLPNLAEPFFSLNFSSYNTEVKLISNRFLSITFPYHVKTVCFRDLCMAKQNSSNSCPNTFYQYDQLYVPEEEYNRFYLAKENWITCHKFCLQVTEKTKIETVWKFDVFASNSVHPLFNLSSSKKSNKLFAEKVSQLSEGKDFKFLNLSGFENYLIAACHFLISPLRGLYQYKDFLYLLDIRTGKALAIACLPADTHAMESIQNLTDNMLYNQDMHLVRLGKPQRSPGKLLFFYTGTKHRKDYWESEEGKMELYILSQFRRLERLREF